ncbi:MAG: 4-hydroxy-3-methylbut-2-enyl diphosphate reductase [Chloroflexi bacterium]|nr:4-hydroxy-3-methylbut-2-enyl diphosphate reductase [Chloroflexota bacterium]
MKIEKAKGIGFCYGVKRAIDILEKAAQERGMVETLGPVVHNERVLCRLGQLGVKVVGGLDELQGDTVTISSHGATPQMEKEMRARQLHIVNTTCPFVHRAQVAARRLAEAGFFVIIYGDANHTEVKGILGWAGGKGLATLDEKAVAALEPLPRRLGLLAQTTQVPAQFAEFAKKLIDHAFKRNSELRIIDTICHDIRLRQEAALELAGRVGLMFVVGSHTSANTNRLAELCSALTQTYLIETAAEIQPSWLQGKCHIGVAAGASTPEEAIDEVVAKLETLEC